MLTSLVGISRFQMHLRTLADELAVNFCYQWLAEVRKLSAELTFPKVLAELLL
jgi:hypothetical protein